MILIDADALLKQIAENSRGKEGWYGDTWEFINTINDAPTIDAVPVVRCGDCRYYKEPERWCRRLGLVGAFDNKGFCSRGERRTDDA